MYIYEITIGKGRRYKGDIKVEKKYFIEKVSKRISSGKCELFIGSGISSQSKLPSWSELLAPLASDIGIELNEADELPLIAQYIVNNNSGNKNIISTRLVDCFDQGYDINEYHEAIGKMAISTVWTTNYDTLLEHCFSNREYDVIKSDTDLAKPRNKKRLEIIKIHGSIDGDLDEIVLTQQDYDNFLFKKTALAQRLRDTLIQRSLLFLGYGYRDPDIRNVMIEAMKQAHDSTQEHFIILLKVKRREFEPDNEYNQRKRRFELWIKELNRLGIRELVIDSKEELADVLNSIALISRGQSVFVTGSHENSAECIREYGKGLAEKNDICLINGQTEGIGLCALQGFMETCINHKYDLGSRIKMFPNPYAANQKYSNSKELLFQLKKERESLFANTKLLVVFAGGMGTEAEYELALEKGCIILVGIITEQDYGNALISQILSEQGYMQELKRRVPAYYEILSEKKVPSINELLVATEELLKC